MTRRYTKADLAILSSIGLSAPLPVVKKRKNEEAELQRNVISWWKKNHTRFSIPECLLYHVPNGAVFTSVRAAVMLKLSGLRPGAPDLQLDVARLGFHGLRIELKSATGVRSKQQIDFHGALTKQGYLVCVIRGMDELTDTIERYLK